MNIKEIEVAINKIHTVHSMTVDGKTNYSWISEIQPSDVRQILTHIKDLEAENKALKAETKEDKPMNINEISKTAIDIEKHFGWPMRSIPKTLKKLLTHIKDLEAENKALKAETEESKPMNIKKTIEKIESGSCRNVTHAEMRQLVSHIFDQVHELGGLQSANEAAEFMIEYLETKIDTLKERINELETSLLEARN